MAVRVDLHQGTIQIPPHLRHAPPRRLRQNLVLDRKRHRSGYVFQTAGHQERLRRVQDPAAFHGLDWGEAHAHEGLAVIHHLTGPSPRDAQAGGEQAGGIESPLLITHYRRDLTMRAPLARVTRQLRAPGQAGRRQSLAPGGPGRQTAAGRGQFPQARGPQADQSRSADLLHAHRPALFGGGHQRHVSTRLIGEEGRHCIPISGGALIVGVLGSHQQVGQQPLHHTGQRLARTQGGQQACRLLCRDPRYRRGRPARRTQHPDRITGRDARKHTTFEHMYSIASGARAPHAEAGSRNTGTATISRISGAFIDGAFSSRSRRDGPPRPLEPRWAPPT